MTIHHYAAVLAFAVYLLRLRGDPQLTGLQEKETRR